MSGYNQPPYPHDPKQFGAPSYQPTNYQQPSYQPPSYNPYQAPNQFSQAPPPRAPGSAMSVLGLVSILIAVFVGLGLSVMVVASGVLVAQAEQAGEAIGDEDPRMVMLGCGLFLGLGLHLLGVVLAIGAFFQPQVSKVLPVIGLLLNCMALLAFCGLMALGLAIGGA